jgi:D-beta-D-heptose 7-phosphate kinase/D-beta-D-heptose 1-phosphate adenosyltransferase
MFPELEAERAKGRKIVFTSGCFDLLHIGHVRYLTAGKKFGDVLVVGLNTDASTKRLKGGKRPIIGENERREMLLALKPVDYVYLFDEDTPIALMKKVKPDVFIKGGDWTKEQLSKLGIDESIVGRVEMLPMTENSSTTKVIERVVSLIAKAKP